MIDDRILAALAVGPASTATLAAVLGEPEAVIARRLGVLFGTAVAREAGTWRLAVSRPALAYFAASTAALADALRVHGEAQHKASQDYGQDIGQGGALGRRPLIDALHRAAECESICTPQG